MPLPDACVLVLVLAPARPSLVQADPEAVEDALKADLERVYNGDGASLGEKMLKDLKKRKLVNLTRLTVFTVRKGTAFATERRRKAADLTADLLQSGEWEKCAFKPYNFATLGVPPLAGHLHPLLKVRAEFRRILFEMGFEEMSTDRFVESCFWNFDSLFQPQSHPARDAHDTFFLSHPEKCPEEAMAGAYPGYVDAVKAMHEEGGAGSRGYRYEWELDEARKNILRTHTTAVSARTLRALVDEDGGFKPKRFFSIDRVFRNETLDATHLAEFHQVEGVVADRGLGLGDLIGVISEFFRRIGITRLRFKPAYNPYTEPSMEIFGYHPDLKRWTEIGNSGIFRPEMLAPMGLPPDVRVIAWGLSLERPTMIKYRIKNIRDLFGHKVRLDTAAQAAIVRF